MSAQNEEIVRAFYASFNAHDLDTALELVADDLVTHDTFMGVAIGVEPFRQLGAMFLTAFPDQVTTLVKIVSQDDHVAVLHTHIGTHLGYFGQIPPSGRRISISGLELFRIAEGRIAEFWRHDDDAGLLRQIGAIPEPAAQAAM